MATGPHGCVRIIISDFGFSLDLHSCEKREVLCISQSFEIASWIIAVDPLYISFHQDVSSYNFFISFLFPAVETLSLREGIGINIRKMKIRSDLHPVMGKEGVPVDYSCEHKTEILQEEIKVRKDVLHIIFKETQRQKRES